MIFNGAESPKCFFCEYSEKTDEDGIYICKKKNKTVSENDLCRKYKYDVFKREVKRKKKIEFSKFSEEDFKL